MTSAKASPELEEAVELALGLPVAEQAMLLERVANHLAHQISSAVLVETSEASAPWGAQMLELLDQLDTSEWEAMDIDDPVEWLAEQRRQAWERRQSQWNDET